MYKRFVKRGLDLVLASAFIVVLLPVWVILAIAIKLDSKGPVLFRQKRIGIHKKTFFIWKFRTMCMNTPPDMPTHLLQNPQQWITRVGR